MQVAFGKSIITPKNPVGVAMGAFSRKLRSTGLHDDLYVNAILMEINGAHYLTISYDLPTLAGSFYSYMKNLILKELKIPPENIFGQVTHTHHGPDYTGLYRTPEHLLSVGNGILFGQPDEKSYVRLARITLNLVREMIIRLIPCEVAWKTVLVKKEIIYNRRIPFSPAKKPLSILLFRNKQTQKNIGMLINYSCHPVTMGYDNLELTADFIGALNQRITEQSNGELASVFINGACGDINPLTRDDLGYRAKNRKILPRKVKLPEWPKALEFGNYLANESLNLAASLKNSDFTEINQVQTDLQSATIPIQDVTRLNDLLHSPVKFLLNRVMFFVKRMLFLRILIWNGHHYKFPMFKFTVGPKIIPKYKLITKYHVAHFKGNDSKHDFWLLGNPGEPMDSISNRIIASTKNPKSTFFMSQCEDSIGYMGTTEDYNEGGYEFVVSISPITGIFLLEKMKDSIRQMM